MAHARRAGRDDGDIGAALQLLLPLVGLDRFLDLVVGEIQELNRALVIASSTDFNWS